MSTKPAQQRDIVDYEALGSRELYWCKVQGEWTPVAPLCEEPMGAVPSILVETVFEWGTKQSFPKFKSELFTPLEMFTVHKINPIQYHRDRIEQLHSEWVIH